MANRADGVVVVRRTRWSEAMAADVVRDAERSGRNLRDFCRARGSSYERDRRWRIRLASQPVPSKRARGFLSVQAVADAARGVCCLPRCFTARVSRSIVSPPSENLTLRGRLRAAICVPK